MLVASFRGMLERRHPPCITDVLLSGASAKGPLGQWWAFCFLAFCQAHG
jgi:hypothetical protein